MYKKEKEGHIHIYYIAAIEENSLLKKRE